MRSLEILHLLSDSNPEYSNSILDHQFEKPTMWRLDLHGNKWVYLEWSEGKSSATTEIELGDDEVVGFLKAKFPKLAVRCEFANVAIDKLNRLISEVKKEVS